LLQAFLLAGDFSANPLMESSFPLINNGRATDKAITNLCLRDSKHAVRNGSNGAIMNAQIYRNLYLHLKEISDTLSS
jgi:hypothetical protein